MITSQTPPTILDLPPQAKRATARDILSGEKGSYVYFLMLGDECIYVGQTTSLRSRIASHVRCKEFDDIYLLSVAGSNRLKLERLWIKRLSPRMNKKCGGLRKGAGRPPSDDPLVPFSARAPLDLLEKLDALAARKEWTRSQAVTEAIRLLVATR